MDKISLSVYADEVKSQPNKINGKDNETWVYSGILLVPSIQENIIINNLNEIRCPSKDREKPWDQCQKHCSFHIKNNKEIHYKDLDSADVYNIAKKWLPYIVADENIYINIIGINKTNLDQKLFGKKQNERSEAIYSRFFKTLLLNSLNYFFKNYDQITINHIYHDKSTALELHPFFPTNAIKKINQENQKILFKCNDIEFIDSDHRISNSSSSNFIQAIDLILGLAVNCYHFIATQNNKYVLSVRFIPTLEKMMDQETYDEQRHMLISFFPSEQLNLNIAPNNFFHYRKLLIKDEPSLF